jgi:hypothetical protein
VIKVYVVCFCWFLKLSFFPSLDGLLDTGECVEVGGFSEPVGSDVTHSFLLGYNKLSLSEGLIFGFEVPSILLE